jgi:EpsI family protein
MSLRWAPAVVLCLGAILSRGVEQQKRMPLVRSLAEVVPVEIDGFVGSDLTVSEAEARVAGFTNHLLRVYGDPLPEEGTPEEPQDPAAAYRFSIYVGYYETQARGQTIHSPKNCLPGAGWEALSSEAYPLDLPDGEVKVNRYVLQNDTERAVVLYWYQGRGRIAYDEYGVKLDLLRDAALKRRSDEALVRVVVPVGEAGDDAATRTAVQVATLLAPRLDLALPGA